MFQTLSNALFALALVLVPANLLAGGPAWLCVPVDGITSSNQAKCIDLLGDALKGSLFTTDEGKPQIKIERHENQWYATCHLTDDVLLGEVEKALGGSEFSIPRDRMRLFGHVVLEVKSGSEAREAVKTQLDALANVAVSDVKPLGSLAEITIDMPYPTQMRRGSDGVRFWEDAYQWNDLNTVGTQNTPPATAESLPSPKELGKVILGQGAELKDIRFSAAFHCRPIGSVAVPKTPETTQAKS
jgi:hypothetical protein